MNINTDNYEAYLLDYMEGNLSPDEAEQLKAFIAAQGLNWDELTEELPHLEALTITYEGKESLKKKAAVVPLYVKIASAAAAAGLLLTVTLWPEKQLPDVEPIAELKPILPTRLITSEENQALPPRTVSFMTAQTKTAQTKIKRQPTTVRTETVLLADLQPLKAEGTPIALTATQTYEPDFDLIAYQMNSHLAFAQYDENDFEEYEEDAQIIPQSELEQHFSLFPEDVPAWSLAALLSIIPKSLIYTPSPFLKGYCCKNIENDIETYGDDSVDACYEMVCWLKENGKI